MNLEPAISENFKIEFTINYTLNVHKSELFGKLTQVTILRPSAHQDVL